MEKEAGWTLGPVCAVSSLNDLVCSVMILLDGNSSEDNARSFFFKSGWAGVLFLLLAFVACQSEEIPLTRFEDSPIIDSLLASAPHFVVNTDIEAERWIASTRIGVENDSLILGRPMSTIAIGDSFFISDRQAGAIFAVGADGYLVQKIGRSGKGPGEFTNVSELHYNGLHVFTRDQGRVQVFTEEFDYNHSFSYPSAHLRFSVSSDYIFLKCPGDDWLVCARGISPPHNWIPTVELLPVLDLPDRLGENGNFATVSPEGDRIAVAYMGLPYIFVYDGQFRHLRTIRFEGEYVRKFKPFGLPDGVPVGSYEPVTIAFIVTLKFINSRYLVVGAPRTNNYLIDLSENDYKLARKIIFHPINDIEEEEDIAPADFLLHRDHLYVSSPREEYVYGYDFDL